MRPLIWVSKSMEARIVERFTLEDIDYRTGGPARYVRVAETGGRLGFITPLTHNFCESCNRVGITCTGTLFMCLAWISEGANKSWCSPTGARPVRVRPQRAAR
jgi:molybdenum cofactor biosynthesis enzyme MoaA